MLTSFFNTTMFNDLKKIVYTSRMDKFVDVLTKYKFLNSTHVVPTYIKKFLWMLSFVSA